MRTHVFRWPVGLAVLLMSVLALCGGPKAWAVAPELNGDPTVIESGHIDLFAVYAHEGSLSLVVQDDRSGQPILRDPRAVTVKVGESSRKDVPPAVAQLLGVEGLQSAYWLTQDGRQQQEQPFAGWDTMHVVPDFGPIDLEVMGVTGPGVVWVASQTPRGARSPLMSGSFVLTGGEVIHQAQPAHVHTNWLFESPGVYTMRLRAKGVPVNVPGAREVVSPEAEFRWAVGDAAPTPVPVPSVSPSPAFEPTPVPTPTSMPSPTIAPSASAVPTPVPSPAPSPSAVPSSLPSTPELTAAPVVSRHPEASPTVGVSAGARTPVLAAAGSDLALGWLAGGGSGCGPRSVALGGS